MAYLSPDLTPLDCLLWSCLKERVHATPLNNADELKNRFRNECRVLKQHICEYVSKAEFKGRSCVSKITKIVGMEL